MPNATLSAVPGGLALQCEYQSFLVSAIKALPYAERKWDGATKSWIFDPKHTQRIIDLVQNYLGVQLVAPVVSSQPAIEVKMIEMHYLGRCKDRGSESTATGYANGAWSLVFPEAVLKAWFLDSEPTQPDAPKTLYQVLNVKADAQLDIIKKSWRQLVKQWHPDHCKEQDAQEQFQRIQSAYDKLSDPLSRKKYDVGLALTAHAKQHEDNASYYRNALGYDQEYRTPLRCGLLLVRGMSRVGSFIAEEILMWNDIVNVDGLTMVSSWPRGADTFRVDWV